MSDFTEEQLILLYAISYLKTQNYTSQQIANTLGISLSEEQSLEAH
jgi:hypothetical protein